MQTSGGQNNLLRSLGVVLLALLVLTLVSSLITGGQPRMGYPGHAGQGMYLDVPGLLAFLLVLVVKVLWLVLVISIIAGFFVFIKRYVYDENKFDLALQWIFASGNICAGCGSNLKTSYKFCPVCGKDSQGILTEVVENDNSSKPTVNIEDGEDKSNEAKSQITEEATKDDVIIEESADQVLENKTVSKKDKTKDKK